MVANLVPMEGGSPKALDKPIMLIGRNQSCDIMLQTSSKVSRRHCCIVQCGRKYLLRDLGSMNGVRVNTHRVVEIELRPGDHVAIADILFTFRIDEPGVKEAKRLKQQGPQDPAPSEISAQDEKPESRADMPDVVDPDSHTFSDDELPPVTGNGARLKDDSQSRPEFVKV